MLKKLLKIILFLFLFVIALTALSSIGFLLLNHAHTIKNIDSFIQNHSIYFALWRYSLMGIFVYFYPHLIKQFYGNKEDIDPEKLKKYSRRRYVIVFFVLFEVLLVQHGLSWVVNKLIGM